MTRAFEVVFGAVIVGLAGLAFIFHHVSPAWQRASPRMKRPFVAHEILATAVGLTIILSAFRVLELPLVMAVVRILGAVLVIMTVALLAYVVNSARTDRS